jgi:hypothetical protein
MRQEFPAIYSGTVAPRWDVCVTSSGEGINGPVFDSGAGGGIHRPRMPLRAIPRPGKPSYGRIPVLLLANLQGPVRAGSSTTLNRCALADRIALQHAMADGSRGEEEGPAGGDGVP